MKSVYERTNLIITEFDMEDVITTSGQPTTEPDAMERENSYISLGSARSAGRSPGGSWF